MAPRKTTASADRNASRKTQDAAGDQAGLVALTTTLLAGAVTGAVAGLIDTADARHLRQETATPSPDEPRGHDDRIEPEQAPHILGASTADSDAAQVLRPDEAIRTDAAQVTNADPVTLPQIQETSSHQPAADAIVMSQAAATAGSSVSHIGEAPGATVRAPAADMASPNGAAALSSGGVADQLANVVSSIDPVGTHQTVSSLDDVSGRLDHAIAAINDGLTGSFAAIDTGQADIARTLDEVHETLDSKLGAALQQIDGHLSHVADTIEDIGASLTEVFTQTPVAMIPASILGADQDDRQPDGLLAKLFDTAAVLPSSEAGSPHMHDTAVAIVHNAAPNHTNVPVFSTDFQISEMASAIDALKIGFAGQPYAESSEGHDGPAGSHANLLHGLL